MYKLLACELLGILLPPSLVSLEAPGLHLFELHAKLFHEFRGYEQRFITLCDKSSYSLSILSRPSLPNVTLIFLFPFCRTPLAAFVFLCSASSSPEKDSLLLGGGAGEMAPGAQREKQT